MTKKLSVLYHRRRKVKIYSNMANTNIVFAKISRIRLLFKFFQTLRILLTNRIGIIIRQQLFGRLHCKGVWKITSLLKFHRYIKKTKFSQYIHSSILALGYLILSFSFSSSGYLQTSTVTLLNISYF